MAASSLMVFLVIDVFAQDILGSQLSCFCRDRCFWHCKDHMAVEGRGVFSLPDDLWLARNQSQDNTYALERYAGFEDGASVPRAML